MWLGYLNQDHAHYYYPEYLDDGEGRMHFPGNMQRRTQYSHQPMTERALAFIKENRARPFFLYAAYTLPHFGSKQEDVTQLPIPSDAPYGKKRWTQKEKNYAAMVSLLDRDVGRIVKRVDELGLRKDTLIIFTSDNGPWGPTPKRFASSGGLRGAKRDLYEGGIRVPFIARWPGTVPGGRISDEVIAAWDMLPTFAELAGAKQPKGVDGRSVVEALKGWSLRIPHDYLYWDYGHCRKRYHQAVRLGAWKGIRLGQREPIQLYDLQKDSAETRDVAAGNPKVVKQIAEIMESAVTPSYRYPVGEIYKGKPIWRAEDHVMSIPPVAQVGEGGLEAAEFVYDPKFRPTPQCHASTIEQLPDGELIAAWFGGTVERHVDNSIWVARKTGDSWTKPVAVVDGSEGIGQDLRTGNPVLFQPKEGPLMLFYKVVPADVSRASHWWGMLTTSADGGETWSEPRKLGEDSRLGSRAHLIGPVKNRPIQLDDGAILCASSTEHQGWRVHFELTRDLGRTWELIGPINDGSRFNAIQPGVLQHSDGRLQIMCRSQEGVIAQSWSMDDGKTWSAFSASNLPNPNAATDALTLKDGRHLLVYNHTARKGAFPAHRAMLNVAISDIGVRWKPILTLERAPGEYSYPSLIQAADGRVHVTYTYRRETVKHVVLDPAKLDLKR